MAEHDDQGLVLTTESPAAAAALRGALDDFFAYRLSASDRLKAAVAADPGFLMAQVMRGFFLLLLGTRGALEKAARLEDELRPLAAGVTAREAAHLEAFAAWRRGDNPRAAAVWGAIADEHPRDLLALKLQHLNAFWMGQAETLLEGPAGALSAWAPTDRGYGTLLAMLAFGLGETGDLPAAERWGRAAVEAEPADLWGWHAVAHSLEMQERWEDGRRWLSVDPALWADRNPFKSHVWWHQALFHLEGGDDETVRALYRRDVLPDAQQFYLGVQNAVSLLARLELLGLDVAAEWPALADIAESRAGDLVLPFTDLHCVLALAAAGRFEAAEAWLPAMADAISTLPGYAAAGPVVVPVAEGVIAFYRRDWRTAVEKLHPLRQRLAPVGGSRTQRDLFLQLLLVSAHRSGQAALARQLLSGRRLSRPQGRLLAALA